MFDSASPGGVLERAVDAEDEQHQDFLRLVCAHFVLVPKTSKLPDTRPANLYNKGYLDDSK